ncbi:MAG: PD-(D/E)XK nuclease family protein [Dehalococcoidia bacterium]|nr:PD-(D/E)XK nuclease family protein [Dehalococcoidia bacterium]
MPRKMVVQREGQPKPEDLVETLADSEQQLHDLVQNNPDLLPVEEFGMQGPLLVVGKETTVVSGAIDLVALTRDGEILVVEFKTGPQNTDFRSVVAQLLDYGAQLWRLSYEDFETSVAVKYFRSNECKDTALQRKATLREAVDAKWPTPKDADAQPQWDKVRSNIERQLASGSFHYVIAAQSYTEAVLKTIRYLNDAMRTARFYAIEVVCFKGDAMSAFESRTVWKPNPPVGNTQRITRGQFLTSLTDESYRKTIGDLLDACEGLGLQLYWGSLGVSIRLQSADPRRMLSVAWVYPPGRGGWNNLKDIALGYDPASTKDFPGLQSALERYVAAVSKLDGATPAKSGGLRAYQFGPNEARRLTSRFVELWAKLGQESEQPEVGNP